MPQKRARATKGPPKRSCSEKVSIFDAKKVVPSTKSGSFLVKIPQQIGLKNHLKIDAVKDVQQLRK